jgi:tetratricopeptide (TPR) repeat protein
VAVQRASVEGEIGRTLEGLELAIAGQLAALSPAEASELVAAAGGRLVSAPTTATAFLVVGAQGVPLSEDGGLGPELEELRSLAAAGHPIPLVSEQEFLERLGLEERGAHLSTLYTSAQLGRILDVPQRRLQSWVRHGLIRPARVVQRLAYFDFRQVAAAKALSRLTAAGVTPRRIRASLEELQRWWPEAGATLGQLSALEERGRLLVRTPDGALAETSGQLRLEFPPEEPGSAGLPESEFWFQRALRLEEEERPEEAVQAYARGLDPAHPRPEIAFNLGNALYALGRFADAAAAFTLATEVDPAYVEAWNNLGNALARQGRQSEACCVLERALALAPDYADAHFNLAETLAAQGELEGAREHWRAYLALDPSSVWADEARARLRRTE